MNFPCEFSIKIMGRTEVELIEIVTPILGKHIFNMAHVEITSKKSRDENYISITATFIAVSQEQLDDLYRELSGHPDILMVL